MRNVNVCFAMTMKKSQGHSLSCVGLLPKSIFIHGQFYVRNFDKMLQIRDEDGNKFDITYVDYTEIFYKFVR